jgi:hypothetical protein
MLPVLRSIALLAFVALLPSAHAFEVTCAATAPSESVACEQQRADRALGALTERYTQVWSQLVPERRTAFAAAERRWLNGGRWDDHAACVASGAGAGPAEVVAARCLADVTAAHLDSLNAALNVRVASPQN